MFVCVGRVSNEVALLGFHLIDSCELTKNMCMSWTEEQHRFALYFKSTSIYCRYSTVCNKQQYCCKLYVNILKVSHKANMHNPAHAICSQQVMNKQHTALCTERTAKPHAWCILINSTNVTTNIGRRCMRELMQTTASWFAAQHCSFFVYVYAYVRVYMWINSTYAICVSCVYQVSCVDKMNT